MSTVTLTSLAMLKVNIDQGKDYLDYLRPFIMQVFYDHKPELVTDNCIQEYIRADYGLEIPLRSLQIVIKRIARQHSHVLKKEQGIYKITGELVNPKIKLHQADAERHIKSVIEGLKEYSNVTSKPIKTEGDAVSAICAFLSQFNIQCVNAYLRGTAIPDIEGTNKKETKLVLVSKYIQKLQNNDPERFESFMVVVKGHMLANALLCPDLQDVPKTYKVVTFYLDTPLLIRRLGLEGESKKASVESLIELLINLGATVATFSHLRDELERVIKGAADHIESPNGRANIILESRKLGTSRSDLFLLASKIDEKLEEAKIKIIRTPQYKRDFQIDEIGFEQILDDEISYFNPKAKEYDINSVRSIYVLRANSSPMSLERAKAVIVTSNAALAKAAFEYGQKNAEVREVSSVITDFSLANMAWLKAPLGAPNLPIKEVLAVSYAALHPSKELLDKYMTEVDKLQKQGKITARDHQLLRSSHLAQDELMNLTLGEESELTEQTITETLKRVTVEIKKEENEKFMKEKEAHQNTLEQLKYECDAKDKIRKKIYWHCNCRAKICAWSVSIMIILLLILGLSAGLLLKTNNPWFGWFLLIASVFAIGWSSYNWLFGTSIKKLHQKTYVFCSNYFIKSEANKIGLDIDYTK